MFKKPQPSQGYNNFKKNEGGEASPKKKISGKVLFRIKKKGDDGKYALLGSLFENTDTTTGDVFYSLSVMDGASLDSGIYRAFDATIPFEAKK